MKIGAALLGLSLLWVTLGSAQAGLIGDVLDPLFPARSTPELDPSVLTGIAAAGVGGYPLLLSFLKRLKRRNRNNK